MGRPSANSVFEVGSADGTVRNQDGRRGDGFAPSRLMHGSYESVLRGTLGETGSAEANNVLGVLDHQVDAGLR